MMAIAGGGLALRDGATSTLAAVDETGVVRATVPMPIAQAQQVLRAGEWMGSDSAGGLTAVTAPFVVDPSGGLLLQEAPFAFAQTTGSPRRQAGARTGYPDRERAALRAMDYIYPSARDSGAEFGGLICQRGDEFVWSRFVTQMLQDQVAIPDDICGLSVFTRKAPRVFKTMAP